MVPLSSLEDALLGFVEIKSRHPNLNCCGDSTKLFYGDENIDTAVVWSRVKNPHLLYTRSNEEILGEAKISTSSSLPYWTTVYDVCHLR